jgi:hypothetical protein
MHCFEGIARIILEEPDMVLVSQAWIVQDATNPASEAGPAGVRRADNVTHLASFKGPCRSRFAAEGAMVTACQYCRYRSVHLCSLDNLESRIVGEEKHPDFRFWRVECKIRRHDNRARCKSGCRATAGLPRCSDRLAAGRARNGRPDPKICREIRHTIIVGF